MNNKIEGTISMLNLKIPKEDKDAFFNECTKREVKPSMVTRKLIKLWMCGELKLEI